MKVVDKRAAQYALAFFVGYFFLSEPYMEIVMVLGSKSGTILCMVWLFFCSLFLWRVLRQDYKKNLARLVVKVFVSLIISTFLFAVSQVVLDYGLYDSLQYGVTPADILYSLEETPIQLTGFALFMAVTAACMDMVTWTIVAWIVWRVFIGMFFEKSKPDSDPQQQQQVQQQQQ